MLRQINKTPVASDLLYILVPNKAGIYTSVKHAGERDDTMMFGKSCQLRDRYRGRCLEPIKLHKRIIGALN